ncbi:hypothetical protein CHU98_g5592 [Xylaria longipes]|nr:hypothetical protein CHU98_g5592 [Xylaria longipes]
MAQDQYAVPRLFDVLKEQHLRREQRQQTWTWTTALRIYGDTTAEDAEHDLLDYSVGFLRKTRHSVNPKIQTAVPTQLARFNLSLDEQLPALPRADALCLRRRAGRFAAMAGASCRKKLIVEKRPTDTEPAARP